ncbi:MAG TPA: hypothetical protein VFQ38_07140 [Longimicrobiales bacterium]|nr:hypothetical protein [Longimicrobiales bacterium]
MAAAGTVRRPAAAVVCAILAAVLLGMLYIRGPGGVAAEVGAALAPVLSFAAFVAIGGAFLNAVAPLGWARYALVPLEAFTLGAVWSLAVLCVRFGAFDLGVDAAELMPVALAGGVLALPGVAAFAWGGAAPARRPGPLGFVAAAAALPAAGLALAALAFRLLPH